MYKDLKKKKIFSNKDKHMYTLDTYVDKLKRGQKLFIRT